MPLKSAQQLCSSLAAMFIFVLPLQSISADLWFRIWLAK